MLCENRDYKPMLYYAQNLNVSTRTIANDLKSINDLIKEYQLILKRKPNYGVLLIGTLSNIRQLSSNCDQLLLSETAQDKYERQAFILKYLILQEKQVTFEKLAFDLNVSTFVISKDMSELRHFMNTNCNIISDLNGTSIVGTEFGKQKVLIKFFAYYMRECFPGFSTDKLVLILSKYYPVPIVETVKHGIDYFLSMFEKN